MTAVSISSQDKAQGLEDVLTCKKQVRNNTENMLVSESNYHEILCVLVYI